MLSVFVENELVSKPQDILWDLALIPIRYEWSREETVLLQVAKGADMIIYSPVPLFLLEENAIKGCKIHVMKLVLNLGLAVKIQGLIWIHFKY